jgi:hypothetical protein
LISDEEHDAIPCSHIDPPVNLFRFPAALLGLVASVALAEEPAWQSYTNGRFGSEFYPQLFDHCENVFEEWVEESKQPEDDEEQA